MVEASAPYGLAPLSGSITDVGIVGCTTGGGLGPMARTYGLAAARGPADGRRYRLGIFGDDEVELNSPRWDLETQRSTVTADRPSTAR